MNPAIVGVFIPIIAIISVFTFLTVIIVSANVSRTRERQALYDTAKLAIEKGESLPPEVIAELAAASTSRRTAFADLRAGVIWLAAGVGTGIFGVMISLIEDAEEAFNPLVGLAAIPTLIGIALIVLSRFNPHKDKPRVS